MKQILIAIKADDTEQVRSLLAATPDLIYEKDPDGLTVLHWAARSGSEKVAEMLISKSPKLLDAVTNIGSTALHWAARSGSEKVAEMLISKSPKLIDAVTNDGRTALHFTAHEKVAEMLIAKNPKLIDAVDNNGDTALHWAAYRGNEKAVEILLQYKPELVDAVNTKGLTALHEADGKGHKKIVETLSKAKDDLPLKLKKLDIYKLLLAQLQNEKDINVALLDLANHANDPVSPQQLKDFVDLAIKNNKIIALALYLHGEAWASLVIKHIGDDNLQLIYNDPTGNAFGKEPTVLKLISSLIEQNHNGDTTPTDLRKSQQNIEGDSGRIVVDNLVRLATAKSFKKVDLQKLLLGAEQLDKLKVKHLLIEETTPEYSDYKLKKLLELSLMDKPIIIAPTTAFENKYLLIENTRTAVQQVTDSGVPIIMPLSAQGKYWSGLVIKKQLDGSLQVIYSNPTGDSLRSEKNSMKLIKTIVELTSEVHIIDLKHKQESDKQASGSFTVNNLMKLALSDTNNFHTKDFQKLLSTSENIDQLHQQHHRLLQDYIIDLNPGLKPGEGREAFEQKGDWSEEKEKYIAPPPYEQDNQVQMHVLGEDTEA